MIRRFFTKEKMVWLYWGLSIIGYLLIFYNYRATRCFLTVGASSLLISFGVFVSDDYGVTLSIVAVVWCLLFFVLSIVSVFKIIKKQYHLFNFLIGVDTVITLVWVSHLCIIENWYSFNVFVLDAVISVIYVLFFYKCKDNNQNKKREKTVPYLDQITPQNLTQG